MSISRILISATAALVLSALPGAAALAADEPPPVSHDGLDLVEKGRLDVVYRRAGVDFAGYTRIMLDPFEVAFKKQWTRDFRRVSDQDRERIREGLSEEAHKVFIKEIQEKGGYEIVDRPAPDVLRVSAAIIELYIDAPDTMQTGRSRTYTVSAGEATLVAELVDSVSGEVVGRAADRERARESATFQWRTRSTNLADARLIFGRWAGALRDALDEAHGKPK
ncbi:MAG: DUF3313 family protein [Burkholderiales bacterium]